MKAILPSSPALPLLGAVLLVQTFSAAAQEADKSGYHLFSPVPVEQMRPIAGDRPDGTESPTTVDAGHVQIEMSLVDYTTDDLAGVESEILTAGATNVRIGLLNSLELQILFDSYTREKVRGQRSTTVTGSFSDVTLRPKLNLWGNDGGATALALMPAVKIPTGAEFSNGEVEGALIVPFGMDWNECWSLGLMAEVDWVHRGESDDYDTEFLHTAVLGCGLTEQLGIYFEYIGITGGEHYQPYFSSGATFSLTGNLVLDAGAVVGLSDDATDLQVFTGFTVRF